MYTLTLQLILSTLFITLWKLGLGKHTYQGPKMQYLSLPKFPDSFYNMDIMQTFTASEPNNHVRWFEFENQLPLVRWKI